MACRLFGAKPLPEPVMTYCQLDPYKWIPVKFKPENRTFQSWKCIWKWWPFWSGEDELIKFSQHGWYIEKVFIHIQSSAVITQFDIAWYCTQHCRSWGRISIRGLTPTRHPYLVLTGELWGVFHEYFEENWPRYNGTALYLLNSSPVGSSNGLLTEPKLT